ncbi:MAG: sensor histidine kinase [Streptococcus sp.]
MFPPCLNQGQEQIRLQDEIDHMCQYLFIQKQRYGDKLNYEILKRGHWEIISFQNWFYNP